MEKVFGEITAVRIVLGRLIAHHAKAEPDWRRALDNELQSCLDALHRSVRITTDSTVQESGIRREAERVLKDIFEGIAIG